LPSPVISTLSLHDALPIYRLCCRSFSARSYKSLSASADSLVSGLEAVVFLAAQPVKSSTARIAAGQLYVACIGFKQPFLLFAPKDRKSTRLNSSHLVISYA